MPTDPARRALTAARQQLVAAHFQLVVAPRTHGCWRYIHTTRHHRITVVLTRGCGHQVVIYAHWEPGLSTWICDHEYGHDANGQPYDIPTAVQHALELADQERSAA